MRKVSTFLMFQGEAEKAIELYRSVFDGFDVKSIEKYGRDDDGPEGQFKLATIDFEGQRLMVFDSPLSHDFGFTPAMSLYVDLADEQELDRAFQRLSDGGNVLMPLDDHGFSRKFAWLSDPFGVSWQLNLPNGK